MREYTKEQIGKIEKFVMMTDLEFYERFLSEAPLEEQAEFFKEFPDFLAEESA